MWWFLHNWNPIHAVDRWLAMWRLGPGVRFVVPPGTPLQKALRTLQRYGVRTYGYTFAGNERAFRVRSEQAAWASYLLQRAGVPILEGPRVNAKPGGVMPSAWSDKDPRAAVRSVGFAGIILDFFQRF